MAFHHARMHVRMLLPLVAWFLASCGPGPARSSPLGSPASGPSLAPSTGHPESLSDTVTRRQTPADIRTSRFPRAGKPALCEEHLAETRGDLERQVERAIDRRAIASCHQQFATTEPVLELSFVVAEDGRIVTPHARGVDYMLAACIERAVTDACVGTIVDDRDQPVALSFTIEMYLTR